MNHYTILCLVLACFAWTGSAEGAGLDRVVEVAPGVLPELPSNNSTQVRFVDQLGLAFDARGDNRIGLRLFFIFSTVALLMLWITYNDHITEMRNRWLDFIVFLLSGLSGCLVLWLISDLSTPTDVQNICWALAPNTVIAFVTLRKRLPKWFRAYTLVQLILLLAITAYWIISMGYLSFTLIPLLLFLGIRYVFLWRWGFGYRS